MEHQGFTIWFTGLSGAGKTTVSRLVESELRARGYKVEVLDGDVVRENLSKGLGFSKEDRDTNIRRIGFVCELLTRNDVIAIAAAISPYRAIRDENRARVGGRFVDVYAKCPLDVLAERDVKGLYKKAMRGEIKNFTGVDDPYEPPLNPEVVIESDQETPEQSAAKVIAKLEELGYVHVHDPNALGFAHSRNQVWIDYDKEADVLHISFRKPQQANDSVMENNVVYHYDGKELVGVTVINARAMFTILEGIVL